MAADSIGTCIGGCLGGPIIGAICGAANNLIYGFSAGDNITYLCIDKLRYWAVGIMAPPWICKSFPKADSYPRPVQPVFLVVISTPLNVLF